MALAAAYQKFLSDPTTSALAPNASINYIPTLTSINEPTAILKHLAAQTKALKKKSEKALNVIEGNGQLCAEYDTVLEIASGGGAYLPGLDDNFLVDKMVTLPIIHIVNFDASNTITNIRLHWDQASLLKQVGVIGARARNWPIRDGKDQSQLITSIVTGSHGASQRPTSASTDTASSTRSHASSNASNYTTSSIFQGSNNAREDGGSFNGNAVSPRSAVKPVSRDLADILSGADTTLPTSPIGSPLKETFGLGGNQRIGAEKHFQPIRLFDENTDPSSDNAPDIKTNPKKFNHFEFADSDESTPLQSAPLTAATKPVNRIKHQSQWDFSDFTTPEKPKASALHNQAWNVGWSD